MVAEPVTVFINEATAATGTVGLRAIHLGETGDGEKGKQENEYCFFHEKQRKVLSKGASFDLAPVFLFE